MSAEKKALFFPFLLVFYEVATYLSNDMYLPSLPGLENEFNVSQELAQYTLLMWFLGSASMHLIMGPLSDRFGRRVVLLTGGVFYVISSVICAMTQDINIMLVARFVQGSTVCSVVVAGYATVHELYDSKRAMKVIAIMGSITVLAPAFGPLFGALFVEYAHWRGIFWFLAILAAMPLAALYKIMPETNPQKRSINVAKISADYQKIFTRRAFLHYTLPFSLLFMALICWIVESPFLVMGEYGKSPIDYGVIQFYIFGFFLVGAQLTGWLVYRIEASKIVLWGLIVGVVGATLLSLVSIQWAGPLVWVVLGLMLYMFGVALAFGPLNRLAVETCEEPMGSRMAIFFTIMNVFGVLGTVVVPILNAKSMAQISTLILFLTLLAFFVYGILQKPKLYALP